LTANLYTLGHSARPFEELEQLLLAHGIGLVADIRRFPRSRHNHQFNCEQLARSLSEVGVRYAWLGSLGGRRRREAPTVINGRWRNPSFRAFADYMLTDEFEKGLSELIALARYTPLAMMCAEAVPWRCHRSLIADVLTARGFPVFHIVSRLQTKPHRLTTFARVEGGQVTYPGSE
jgi:uncharacterized protein (DUF488 family)